jgi:serine/threonine protein kinase
MISAISKEVRLLDLGSFSEYKPNGITQEYTGPMEYGSPEVQCMYLERDNMEYTPARFLYGYDTEAQEVWTIGLILFKTFFGTNLFANQKEILELDIESRIDSLLEETKQLHTKEASADLKSALLTILCRHKPNRPKMREVLQLPYFRHLTKHANRGHSTRPHYYRQPTYVVYEPTPPKKTFVHRISSFFRKFKALFVKSQHD